jgi:hypothetical protein
MKTLLTLDKLGLAGRTHREQLSKSFTLNMVQFLYMQMTQNNMSAYDVAYGYRTVYLNQSNTANFIVQPGMGDVSSRTKYAHSLHWEMPGIRVGTGVASPTPADYSMLSTMIPNSWQAPEGANAVKWAYDWLQSNTGANNSIYGSNWVMQLFHVREPINISGCQARFWRQGSLTGRTLTIGLRRTYGEGNLVTGDLVSGTLALSNTNPSPTAWPGTLLEVDFNTPYVCHPGYQYALVMRIDAGDYSNCLYTQRSQVADYGKPDHCGADDMMTSSNGGASWSGFDSEYQGSCGYYLLGQIPVGLAYSGTKVFPVTISGATAQFILEALFSNYSGQAITVSEVGLHCYGFDNAAQQRPLVYLLAHDLLGAPVTVNNGEILRVRYIPQVTV